MMNDKSLSLSCINVKTLETCSVTYDGKEPGQEDLVI